MGLPARRCGVQTFHPIGQAIAETRQLLNEHHRTILPTTLRFTTTAALMQFLSNGEPEPPRLRVSDRLAHPALTGLPAPSSPP